MNVYSLGISSHEAKLRQSEFGFNELIIKNKNSFLKSFYDIITEPIFSLLVVAGLIYLIIGSIEDAIVLLAFIMISAGITLFQQQKSKKAIQALKDLSSPRALVVRDKMPVRIPGREIVVGDVLIIQEGDRIPADATIIECNDLLIDESLLTGESEAINKKLNDKIYSGCMLVRGSGFAVVDAIGPKSELGKIGKSLEEIGNSPSPLQKEFFRLIKKFAFFGMSLSALVFLIYGFLNQDWLQGALYGISLTMALLPEEFTIVLTVFMAIGAWRIAQKQVLTRHAAIIETLGSINVLCVDKTGTLTENKMSL